MTTWKCMSPAQTSPLNSRLIYPTACLTSPLGSLIIITDIQVPNGIPDLIHAPLPHLKKWQFHSSSCSVLSFAYPHLYWSRKSWWLLSSIYPQSDHFSLLTLQLPWSKPPSWITSIIALISNWPPWLCLWYLAVHAHLRGQNLSCQTFNKGFSCLSEEKLRSSQWPGDLTDLALSHDFIVTSIILNSA